MLRANHNLLIQWLAALWLVVSSVGVLHAAEHALDNELHACEVCIHANAGAAPAQAATLELPKAAVASLVLEAERDAHAHPDEAHAPRGPPAKF